MIVYLNILNFNKLKVISDLLTNTFDESKRNVFLMSMGLHQTLDLTDQKNYICERNRCYFINFI